MSKLLNKYDEFFNSNADDKIKYLEGEDDLKKLAEMNRRVEKTKREYQAKEMNSQIASAKIRLR